MPSRRLGLAFEDLKTLTLTALLKKDWIVRDTFLTIDLSPFIKRTHEWLDRLGAARAIVTSSPDVLGGAPVIRETRIPVYDVAASVAAGMSTKRILVAYPGLDAEKIELAAIYAEVNGHADGRAPVENCRKDQS